MILYKKWTFPWRISLVNVNEAAVSCRFGHIYWRNPKWKTSFFVQCEFSFHLEFLIFQTLTKWCQITGFLWPVHCVKKCPYSDFFCSLFSRIRTEYWKIRSFIGKEIPSQVFSWEYWGIFRNNFFEEYLRTAASAATNLGKSAYVTVLLWSVCWLGSFEFRAAEKNI